MEKVKKPVLLHGASSKEKANLSRWLTVFKTRQPFIPALPNAGCWLFHVKGTWNLHQEEKDATFFTYEQRYRWQFHSVGVDHPTARACNHHVLPCDCSGLSHDFRHGALRESSG
jgi:hypothetical protein